mmetsp:Transcript_27934/g.46310  ORF Transcript_27934/g.46310 Transcript_27934/m.46310 type:complete len:81 (+) Transcript_27934:649-891(+)
MILDWKACFGLGDNTGVCGILQSVDTLIPDSNISAASTKGSVGMEPSTHKFEHLNANVKMAITARKCSTRLQEIRLCSSS